jgi:hypothetical protein
MFFRAIQQESFNIETCSAMDVAGMIRDLVKAVTTPNFDKSMLNTYSPTLSVVLDTNYDGWTFTGSTRDGNDLGSTAGQGAIGDTWDISKGGKTVRFTIGQRPGEKFHIIVSKVGEQLEYWIRPDNRHSIVTSSSSDSLTVGEWILGKYQTF